MTLSSQENPILSWQEIQLLVEKTSKVCEVVTDIFSSAAAAGEILPLAPGSFQLQLLREPLQAIAEAHGFGTLSRHRLLGHEKNWQEHKDIGRPETENMFEDGANY